MHHKALILAAAAFIHSQLDYGAAAQELDEDVSPSATCAALESISLEEEADSPARIISATYVEDGNKALKASRRMFVKRSIVQGLPIAADANVPSHCRVEGYVAPASQFLIMLPDPRNWNKRALYAACDAFCGAVDDDQNVAGLVNGFASITSDGGHVNKRPFDGVWAADNRQGEIDFGYRTSHLIAQTIKAVSEAYYGARPDYSYITGFSKGGHAGIMSALRYPGDYDGALSRSPVVRYQEINAVKMPWLVNANTRDDGSPILLASDIPLIHRAAINACDKADGVEDGIIDDARKCVFDPSVLLCETGVMENCLTPEKVGALYKFYEQPKNQSGEVSYPYGLEVGSELDWPGFYVPRSANAEPFANDIARTFLRYMAFPNDPGPDFDYLAFDPVKDRKKLKKMKSVYDANSADLEEFRDAGGKLIVLHGWGDGAVSARMTLDWYKKVVAKFGETDTQSFARLFLTPGNKHGGSPGDGPNVNESFKALQDWVEKGAAPESLILKDDKRERIVFPYPQKARYSGKGGMDSAASYEAIRDSD